MTKKVYIRTFGCQMNEYDSDKMADVLHAAEHTISCAAHPGNVLQPADDSPASGVGVVLASPGHHGPTQPANPWIVTSPRLPSGGLTNA